MNIISKKPESFRYTIPARCFEALEIEVSDTIGFWVFDVSVDLTTDLSLDIGSHVADRNYIRWTTVKQTAGSIEKTPIITFIASSKHCFEEAMNVMIGVFSMDPAVCLTVVQRI